MSILKFFTRKKEPAEVEIKREIPLWPIREAGDSRTIPIWNMNIEQKRQQRLFCREKLIRRAKDLRLGPNVNVRDLIPTDFNKNNWDTPPLVDDYTYHNWLNLNSEEMVLMGYILEAEGANICRMVA